MSGWFFGEILPGSRRLAPVAPALTVLSNFARRLRSTERSGPDAATFRTRQAGSAVPFLRTSPVATISAISTSLAMANLAAWAVANFAAVMAALAGAAALCALLAARQTLTATTLTSAWGWALAAVVAWSGVEFVAGAGLLSDASWLDPLRLAAIGLSFCPAISLIGAKRPQHAAWNFIVVSLWGIVLLPAAETFFLQRGQALEMGDARGWFRGC
jgi:hypothetical protein